MEDSAAVAVERGALQIALKKAAFAVAVAMSLYHMYVVAFGPPEALIFRGIHLLFALTLVYMLFPVRRAGSSAWRIIDLALLAGGWGFLFHIFLNYQYYTDRMIYVDDLTSMDKFYAVVAVVVVLDATRRVIGWALPITAVLFIAYAAFFTQVAPQVLMEQLYLSTEGIFGSTLGVSASYVIMFVVFGSFMEKSGTGQLFMDFALAATGSSAGGPGKVAVVSSSLFGTVSGSAVANVMVTGTITIPMMKRTGFRPSFAAAVEAVASTGGQLMPPIMGAVAFVMAEFMAVPYLQIAIWASIPALLYYLAVFFAVHFEAKRKGLKGISRDELPKLGRVIVERGHLFLPVAIILGGLIAGYSAPWCALAGTLSCFPVALMRKTTRVGINGRAVFLALEDGARNTLAVAMACACAGIVIGAVTITGLGIVFTQMVLAVSQDSMLLALILTALAGIVLGMGMPTTPAYIVMVALLVPALVKLGVIVPAAHMFALYFAILSAITPPVALAVFAAAGIAEANMWRAGYAAMRAAAPAYIIPFMFVYEPALLTIGTWDLVLTSCVTAVIGVILLASSLFGYFLTSSNWWQRVLMFAAAMLLIKPGLVTDAIGAALFAMAFIPQLIEHRRGLTASRARGS